MASFFYGLCLNVVSMGYAFNHFITRTLAISVCASISPCLQHWQIISRKFYFVRKSSEKTIVIWRVHYLSSSPYLYYRALDKHLYPPSLCKLTFSTNYPKNLRNFSSPISLFFWKSDQSSRQREVKMKNKRRWSLKTRATLKKLLIQNALRFKKFFLSSFSYLDSFYVLTCSGSCGFNTYINAWTKSIRHTVED